MIDQDVIVYFVVIQDGIYMIYNTDFIDFTTTGFYVIFSSFFVGFLSNIFVIFKPWKKGFSCVFRDIYMGGIYMCGGFLGIFTFRLDYKNLYKGVYFVKKLKTG